MGLMPKSEKGNNSVNVALLHKMIKSEKWR